MTTYAITDHPRARGEEGVTPTVAAAGATITVNDVAVVSGSASGSIRLNTGNNNVITIVVTGTDSVTTKTYTLTVNRTDSAIYEPFNYTAAESLNGQAVGASTGLRITSPPFFSMMTSVPSKRKALGRRTAWLPPCWKIFAVVIYT